MTDKRIEKTEEELQAAIEAAKENLQRTSVHCNEAISLFVQNLGTEHYMHSSLQDAIHVIQDAEAHCFSLRADHQDYWGSIAVAKELYNASCKLWAWVNYLIANPETYDRIRMQWHELTIAVWFSYQVKQ